MEEEGKGRERDGDCECECQGEEMENEEFMGIKLKRVVLVGKRGAGALDSGTPPPPSWSFVGSQYPIPKSTSSSSVVTASARQLGANLWEILPHHPLSNMSKPTSSGLHRHRHHHDHTHKGLQIQPVLEETDPPQSDDLPDQPGSTGSFHRQIVESLRRHHGSVNRNRHAIQPVSPASCSSSMEVTPYNGGATPSSSLELKGRIGDSNYSLKTSTELLKVLNRIWMLEEQHSANSLLVRALKMEVDNSRARIKNLLKEKQVDRQVIDDLMKQVAQDKLARKNVEQERIKSSLQSVRDELEDERKLRKRSESLHRKLARELSDVKSSLSEGMGELKRERRARLLLEELCDEFAMGIRDYEKELRFLQYKTEKDQVCSREHVDSLVLHISEVWLDERVQTKLAEESEKGMVFEKLCLEIDGFLKAREHSTSSRKANDFFPKTQETKDRHSNIRRHSLESFHLNEAPSAPNNADDNGESVDSESNCFELSKPVHDYEGTAMKNSNKVASEEVRSNRTRARFQQYMGRAILSNGKSQAENPSKSKWYAAERLARNNSSSMEGDRIHPEDALVDEPHGRLMLAGPTSPVKKWEPMIGLGDHEASESCLRRAQSGAKENTLKAKLMEARLEGRQWHSHSNSNSKASTG